jgi:hypothetical protein
MRRSRARRREQRPKEGSYASSLPAEDAGFLHSGSGLTLLPGSQVPKIEGVENASSRPHGAVSDGDEQEYNSPKQRRSVRLAARHAGSTTKLALETRRARSVASSPALHISSSDYGSDQGKRNRRNTDLPQSATPFSNTIPSPATSITFSSIASVSLPIASSTDFHTRSSDLGCQLPSVELETMSLFNMGNHSVGLPASDRTAYPPTSLQSPFQQPYQAPPQMAPQLPFQPRFQPPIQPNTNTNYAATSNGSSGNVVHPSEADQGILWRRMSEAIAHRDQVIKSLQNDKGAMEVEIKRLNNDKINMTHELRRLMDKTRMLETYHLQKDRLQELCGPSFESPPRGPDLSQPHIQHAIEAPGDRSNPFVPQMQNSIADNQLLVAMQRAAEQRDRQLAQLYEEMARVRSERDHYKANAEKAATYIKNITAMNAAATKATSAKPDGRTALEILSTFRVQTPQPPPRATSAQEQAPKPSDPQAVAPVQLDSPVPSASEAHMASTALSVKTVPSVPTGLPISAAQSKAAASSIPAQHSASSSQQNVTIDLTTEDPSPSIVSNLSTGPTASGPDIGDSSALTALGTDVAPKHIPYAWLGHHPESKEPHPRGWKNIESTPAAMLQKRLDSGSIEPVTARKGKEKAEKAAEKPTTGNKRRKSKDTAEDRPAKKQRLRKNHLRHTPIPGSATDNTDESSTSTDALESDGLDEEMDRLFAMGDDSELADSQADTSILAAPTNDNCPSTSTITEISDFLAEEIERALAEGSSDASEPLGAADGRGALPGPVATFHAGDSGDVLNNSNSSDKCPRCGLDIVHGGERCPFENDGMDDLFEDGEDD